MNRGYESHVRLLFEHLRDDAPIDVNVVLFKGDGASRPDEVVIPTPDRDGSLCRFLARFRGDALYWEYMLFGIAFVARSFFLRTRFDTVSCIEPMVAKVVSRLRGLLPGRPRITFTHGVWMEPPNYVNLGDCIHEVNVENYERMQAHLSASGVVKELVCIPHFIEQTDGRGNQPPPSRSSLGISTRFVVLAVGVIDSDHKRTDHVIRELATLGNDWTLLACGAPKGDDGQRVVSLGHQLLGSRFVHLSLPRRDIWKAYAVADYFVLGSLNEGFGLVLLEAARASLPVLAHDRRLFQWILGNEEACVPMDVPGALAARLLSLSRDPARAKALGLQLRARLHERFTWEHLGTPYLWMLDGRQR